MSVADILTRYRKLGLRGAPLRQALRRHAAVIAGCDPGDAADLLRRAIEPGSMVKRRGKLRPEPLDPRRAAWFRHDKERGLT